MPLCTNSVLKNVHYYVMINFLSLSLKHDVTVVLQRFAKHGCHPRIQSDGLASVAGTEGPEEKWKLIVYVL